MVIATVPGARDVGSSFISVSLKKSFPSVTIKVVDIFSDEAAFFLEAISTAAACTSSPPYSDLKFSAFSILIPFSKSTSDL